jgi:primosomal protein N' (replication factor Y)
LAIVAEVILPLAVKSNFSYLAEKEQLPHLAVGKRVLVNFGRNKIYTGVIRRTYEELDPAILNKLKPIEEILDEHPVLYDEQLKLFEWMAFYYLCTPGEVLKAALPAGLKPESALRIRMREGLEWHHLDLSDKEYLLLEALEVQPVMDFKEVAQLWELLNPTPRLRSMQARGWVELYQEVETRYKPRFKAFLRLADAYTTEEKLREALDSLSRAPKQEDLLMRVVADFYQKKPSPKTETLKATQSNSGIAKALVEKGFLVEDQVQVDRLELYGYKEKPKHVKLNPEQQRALGEIKESLEQDRGKPILLHGITGSGKTHLYIELIKEVLEQKKQVLYLLPEITLTKQIIDRIKSEFGEQVGIYHSRFNDQERVEIWEKVRSRAYEVVIGVRSAIFLPFQELGMIVVDEEHDHSFKQTEPAPRYHARDVAVYYARTHNLPIILGSATPSFESYLNAHSGKYSKVEIFKRAIEASLPKIEIVDMRVERKDKNLMGMFSKRLYQAVHQNLQKGEQVILFQNRRGYAPFVVCQNCGYVPQCINCDISLTFHKSKDHLRCHYCGHTEYSMEKCPQCEHFSLRRAGIGTEKIEEKVQELFPEARVQRMDLDTTRSKMAFQNIISRFESKQIDILVGTQMVSKGLDFENVTLVGVINADNILSFPDFRAYEKAYQLLTQVSGRAGRSKKQGRVMIQTHMPDNMVLQTVEVHAPFWGFFEKELAHRHELGYPPLARLIRIGLVHKDRQFLEQQSLKLDGLLRPYFGVNLLGPDYPLVSRVRNLYHMHFLLKFKKGLSPTRLRQLLQERIETYYQQAEKKTLRINLDVDPQ